HEREVIPTEVERSHQCRRNKHMDIFGKHIESELHRRILYVVPTDQFGLAFGQVKRYTVTLRKSTDQENQETQWLYPDVPVHKSGLLLDNLFQRKRLSNHEQGNQGKPHSQLVADALRGRPHRAHQRKLVVGCPAAQHNTIHTECNHAKHIQDTDIDVGYLQLDYPVSNGERLPPRNDSTTNTRGNDGNGGAKDE